MNDIVNTAWLDGSQYRRSHFTILVMIYRHILNHVTGLHILIQNHVCIWNKRTMPRYRVSLHPDFSIFLKEKKKIKIKETPQKTVDEPPNSNDWPRWLFHVYIYDDIISDITQRGRSVSIYRED